MFELECLTNKNIELNSMCPPPTECGPDRNLCSPSAPLCSPTSCYPWG